MSTYVFAGRMVALLGLYQVAKTLNHEAAFKAAVIDIIREYESEKEVLKAALSAEEMRVRMEIEKELFSGVAPYSG